MKIRFPLFAKLLLWSLLHLIALFVIFGYLLHSQFGSFGSLLLPESARDRVQVMTRRLAGQLENAPFERWGELVRGEGRIQGMEFGLYNGRGEWIAGEERKIPADVFRAAFRRGHRPPEPRSNPEAARPLPPPPPHGGHGPHPESRRGEPRFPTTAFRSEGSYWLVVYLPHGRVFDQFERPVILVGEAGFLGGTPLLFNPRPWLLAGGGALLVSLITWMIMARHLTRPLSEMTRVAGQIAEGCFDVRVREGRMDELGQLAQSINRMARRIAGLLTGQKRFLGDVAHELCAPLARMELALGILEQKASGDDLQRVEDVREELTHMRMLVNELLRFSKASLAQKQISLERVPLAPLVSEAVRREKGREAAVAEIVPEGLVVEADPELLRRALANLVRNALRYAGAEGGIAVEARLDGPRVHIQVRDRGAGVPEEDLEKIFDPFYRVDQSRTAQTGGSGLGLAIVRSCIDSCGGSVTARNLRPRGFEVVITLAGSLPTVRKSGIFAPIQEGIAPFR
ncbi:MAG: HAMP domain-containing sensor histidine kinase [Verrucomicrobiae bacterium]|nr:HAMP domain-containing sensor histidine kinase [Verrucomicrobiae bacterium]